jgi:RES domain-containing protein
MPTAWRIVKATRARSAFDGEGARRHGGRWNSPGLRLVYTAESVSLAALELLVHLQSSRLLAAYALVPARFDSALVEAVAARDLPPRWREYPAPVELQEIGDRWARSRPTAVLQVPSSVVPMESNFLINPDHPDFSRIEVGTPEPFELDPRLRR